MRLAIISDLHLDHWASRFGYYKGHPFQDKTKILEYFIDLCSAQQPDKIIIAGDMWDGFIDVEVDWGDRIIFTPGNHDYYRSSYPSSVNWYENEDIFATTLWTNFSGDAWRQDRIFEQISDKRLIKGSEAHLLSVDFDISWDMIRKCDKDIIVTHFPPSRKSVAREFLTSTVNSYFCNDLDAEIVATDLSARLWICGHVHHSHYYHIHNTMVVCHPLGYPGENYDMLNQYKPLIIEIDDAGLVLANHQEINWKS